MKCVNRWVLLALCLHSIHLCGNQWVKTYSTDPYIGPEIYYLQRFKEGGAKQSGTIYGVRLGYDHIKRLGLYWGIDGLWARGMLEGKVQKEHLKSEFTDGNIEARLGFTFQSKYWRCASITPFTGLGYFYESNHYQHPTPLKIHFKNKFTYVPVGLLTQLFIFPSLSVGLNLKVRILLESEQQVLHDPCHGKVTQHYKEKFQYRVELPMNYFFLLEIAFYGCRVSPFL